MKKEETITQSEWLQALEEVRPTSQPEGSHTVPELMDIWNVKESQVYIHARRLEKVGRLERVHVGAKTFYRLLKPKPAAKRSAP